MSPLSRMSCSLLSAVNARGLPQGLVDFVGSGKALSEAFFYGGRFLVVFLCLDDGVGAGGEGFEVVLCHVDIPFNDLNKKRPRFM